MIKRLKNQNLGIFFKNLGKLYTFLCTKVYKTEYYQKIEKSKFWLFFHNLGKLMLVFGHQNMEH